MSKLQNLKLSVHQSLNELSETNIKLTYKFITDLAEKEKEEATKELLEIRNLLEDIELAKQDISNGELTDWREIRSDV
ncbi:hypothetical protein ACN4EE_01550 [Geminocystis sp. CENA526]|uniref:hypothetical protein n=1 Tax=Geminocystis sp. CENA526 TaxID=1355871 RepID=UPI003D6F0676